MQTQQTEATVNIVRRLIAEQGVDGDTKRRDVRHTRHFERGLLGAVYHSRAERLTIVYKSAVVYDAIAGVVQIDTLHTPDGALSAATYIQEVICGG